MNRIERQTDRERERARARERERERERLVDVVKQFKIISG